MKATIEFPDWIDENEWEFVGYKELERGEYAIEYLNDDEWHFRSWNKDSSFGYYFCFRKKQKFVWPEWVKNDALLRYCPYQKDWYLEIKLRKGGSVQITKSEFELITNLNFPDTSKLDPSQVYIKGED
jgi:hypothetical protein